MRVGSVGSILRNGKSIVLLVAQVVAYRSLWLEVTWLPAGSDPEPETSEVPVPV